MKREYETTLRQYLVEFVVYTVLVVGYYALVLRYLGGWLHSLFQTHRGLYAAATLGLIAAQGVLLDALTRLLLAKVRAWVEG